MFTGSAVATSFKAELFSGVHVISETAGDVFKLALYTNAATLTSDTAVYDPANEVVGVNYVAGGKILVNMDPSSDGVTGYAGFGSITWPNATLTARGCLIYNSSKGNKAVVILDFGSDKSATSGDFIINMPVYASTTALLQIR